MGPPVARMLAELNNRKTANHRDAVFEANCDFCRSSFHHEARETHQNDIGVKMKRESNFPRLGKNGRNFSKPWKSRAESSRRDGIKPARRRARRSGAGDQILTATSRPRFCDSYTASRIAMTLIVSVHGTGEGLRFTTQS